MHVARRRKAPSWLTRLASAVDTRPTLDAARGPSARTAGTPRSARTHQVLPELQRRAPWLSRRHGGAHGAAQGRIQQGGRSSQPPVSIQPVCRCQVPAASLDITACHRSTDIKGEIQRHREDRWLWRTAPDSMACISRRGPVGLRSIWLRGSVARPRFGSAVAVAGPRLLPAEPAPRVSPHVDGDAGQGRAAHGRAPAAPAAKGILDSSRCGCRHGAPGGFARPRRPVMAWVSASSSLKSLPAHRPRSPVSPCTLRAERASSPTRAAFFCVIRSIPDIESSTWGRLQLRLRATVDVVHAGAERFHLGQGRVNALSSRLLVCPRPTPTRDEDRRSASLISLRRRPGRSWSRSARTSPAHRRKPAPCSPARGLAPQLFQGQQIEMLEGGAVDQPHDLADPAAGDRLLMPPVVSVTECDLGAFQTLTQSPADRARMKSAGRAGAWSRPCSRHWP